MFVRILPAMTAAMTVLAAADAQCQFTGIATQHLGAFCNIGSTGCCAVPSSPTRIEPSFDGSACVFDVAVRAVEGCCGVTVVLRALAIGTPHPGIPLPDLGLGCTLWVQPADVRVQTGELFRFPIPPTLPPVTFAAQAAAVIVDPFLHPSGLPTLTQALTISLQ
jgi:hypothetical protein